MDVGSALQAACCAESRCMFILASTEAVHWVVATVFPCKQSSVQHALAKSAQVDDLVLLLVALLHCAPQLLYLSAVRCDLLWKLLNNVPVVLGLPRLPRYLFGCSCPNSATFSMQVQAESLGRA